MYFLFTLESAIVLTAFSRVASTSGFGYDFNDQIGKKVSICFAYFYYQYLVSLCSLFFRLITVVQGLFLAVDNH
jgi:hypothetical protein